MRTLLSSGAFALALFALACGSSSTQNKAAALPPANPVAVSKLAQGVNASKDKDGRKRAIELLEQAVSADGGLWEGRYNLGVLLAANGDLVAAEKQLSEAHKLAPNAEDVVVALGEVRRRLGDYSGAAEVLGEFVKQNPDAGLARTTLVSALREDGKIDEAIKQAQAALVRHANDPYALSELALAQLERNELDTAELLSKEALKAAPQSAVAERTAGLIALERGDDAVAFRHFQRASELDPNDTTARLNTGTVLLQAGVYERATNELRAVVQAEPDNTLAELTLAAANRGRAKRDDMGAYAESEKLLLEVLDREPKNLAATFNLAVLYADFLKRPAEAEKLFRRFLSDAPEKHPARAEAERFLSASQGAVKEAPAAKPAAAPKPAPAKAPGKK
ncbi:MAG TPA: tetratricopeptide repeat protein [Polyangiaceae bacterium]